MYIKTIILIIASLAKSASICHISAIAENIIISENSCNISLEELFSANAEK
jgi:hypothetical protein